MHRVKNYILRSANIKIVFIGSMPKPRGLLIAILLTLTQGSVSWASQKLSLRFHPQKFALSCEAASLRMVLDFHKIQISEDDIIKKMPFDEMPKSGNIWGDPNEGFVGDINGRMGETGYGIHWNPLAKLARTWKKTEVIEHGKTKDLVMHIDQQQPVIVWVTDGPSREISWKSLSGKKIFALNNEHTQVVFGYTGDRNSPTAFHVMDPVKGPLVRPIEEFKKSWQSFGRKGVVVYP